MINNTPSPNPAPHALASTNNRTETAPLVSPLVTPLRVCGYARVSTDLQREKETIRTQVELIEKFCATNGHTLVETFSDKGCPAPRTCATGPPERAFWLTRGRASSTQWSFTRPTD